MQCDLDIDALVHTVFGDRKLHEHVRRRGLPDHLCEIDDAA